MMLYSCTNMANVGVKGLNYCSNDNTAHLDSRQTIS